MAKVVRILMKNGPKKMRPAKRTLGKIRFCIAICKKYLVIMYVFWGKNRVHMINFQIGNQTVKTVLELDVVASFLS